ncbi:MAG: HNH endonuclease, partial [Candidatus Sulfotelmatobacter sp.]
MNVAANSIPAFCLPPFVDPALLSDVFTADNIQLGTVWARSEEFPEYAVSCDGQVMRLQTGLVLRPDVVGNGYMRVSLYRKGRASRRKVHRLVASAFIPNPSNKPFVNHEDGDKIHNRVVNLAWATSKENAEHA